MLSEFEDIDIKQNPIDFTTPKAANFQDKNKIKNSSVL